MQRLLPSSKFFVLTLLVSILIMHSYHQSSVLPSVFASSPSFVKQEIRAAPDDWILWKNASKFTRIPTHDGHSIQVENANNISQCKINNEFAFPGIESVSYISNGKTLNATVWLKSNFKEPPLKDTIDIYQEQLEIKTSKLASSGLTLEKYAIKKIGEMYNPLNGFKIDEQSNSSAIAGNHAYKVVYSARNSEGIDLKNMTFWTIKDSKVYDITYSALQANYSDYLPTIQGMINSIQFEDSTASSKSVRQQVHSHEVSQFEGFGIKITYPIDWNKQEEPVDSVSRGIIFRSPFQDERFETPSWHEITFIMAIAIASVQHTAVTDYRVIFSRNPINSNNNDTWAWERQVTEVSAYGKQRVLEEQKNYTGFKDKDKPYILFSFDLDKINFPNQYKSVFYITDYFVKKHRFCRLIDITNWVNIPPPEFIISTTPNSILLRPGEERAIELTIKGNTNLPSEAFLSDSNNSGNNKDITLNFVPNKISIPPSSNVGTSTLHVKATNNATSLSYTFPIVANISFPNTITNRGGEIFSNSKTENITQTANLTLTVLPPYTLGERLNNFVNTWITPITGVWTFLAGVGAVVAPWVINIYRKKQKKR